MNADFIADDSGNRYDVKKVADVLENLLPKNSLDNFDQRPKISFIVCFAGAAQNETYLESFAAKVQQELARRNRYVDIDARVTFTKIEQSDGKKRTVKLGKEDEFRNIQNSLGEVDGITQELILEINNFNKENVLYQQPNSKISFRLVKDNNNQITQVAYESYQLKEHEKNYQEIKSLVLELREFANQETVPNKKIINNLASNIEKEANRYFRGIDKGDRATQQFKTNCNRYVNKANQLLASKVNEGWLSLIVRLLSVIHNVFLLPCAAQLIPMSNYSVPLSQNSQRFFLPGEAQKNNKMDSQLVQTAQDAVEKIKPVTRFR